ncbi:MAG: hypothetical protein H6733_12435 [Alphaproteobacteria bacterium]|nr:hypothetical protein [Alphaproteobacteria bacterium]
MLPWTLLWTLTAHAGDPTPVQEGWGLQDVVAVDTTTTDTVQFHLPACDRVRAVFDDPRPPDQARSEKVVVTLHNDSAQICLYRGLVLQGSLEGTYVSSIRNPDGTGFFLPAGGDLSFRIKPTDPSRSRSRVELQIAPGRGTIVLIGSGGAPPPAPPPAPAPTP